MNGELPTNVLKSIIWGDDMGLNEATDLDEQVDPMQSFILRNQVNAVVKSASGASVVLDLPLPPSDDVDSEENSPFYKLPQIVKDDGHRTLAKKLGIIRTERVTTSDGDVWIHAFNSSDELVDARILQSRD
jgi:hypothetical protein